MGSSKQKQEQSYNNANTFGWTAPPDTADIDSLRGMQFGDDPHIPYVYARGRHQAHESFNSPTGGYTTPQLRDATLRASDEDSTQAEGQAHMEDNFRKQAMEYGKKATVAGLTAPRLTQTGGSGTSSGTSSYNDSPMDNIVKGASAAGSMAML